MGGPQKHSRRITEKNNTLSLPQSKYDSPFSKLQSSSHTERAARSGRVAQISNIHVLRMVKAIWNANSFLTDVNSSFFNITTQPVRAAGHSPYLMLRLRISGAVPPLLGMPCSNNCTWDMYSTTSSHVISSCSIAGDPVPWQYIVFSEADWEITFKSSSWFRRTHLHLSSSYGCRIRYPLWVFVPVPMTGACRWPLSTN